MAVNGGEGRYWQHLNCGNFRLQVHVNTLDIAAVSPMVYKMLSGGKVERLPALQGSAVRR